MAHKVFLIFLALIASGAVISMTIHGFGYYTTPVHQRPFRSDYESMKTSGTYSHGLGIIGASMIIVGVTTYSTRKRMRALWNVGKLSAWLEFHIFLCLLGPVLVIYHTTFKSGGIAAISLWTMISVASSGLIGRFLYSLIPRNVEGTELSSGQISRELERLGAALGSSPLGKELIKRIDEGFAAIQRPETLGQTIGSFIKLQSIRTHMKTTMRAMLALSAVSRDQAHQLYRNATERAALLQKSMVLTQAGKLFYYWHAIHLPFSVIMFLTLAAHIVVTVLMGYTWIF